MKLSKYIASTLLLALLSGCTGDLTEKTSSLNDAGGVDAGADAISFDANPIDDANDSGLTDTDLGIYDTAPAPDTDIPNDADDDADDDADAADTADPVDTDDPVADTGPDIDTTPPDPCNGSCGTHAQCIEDACVCDEGFRDASDGGCEAIVAGDPASHTNAAVCQRFDDAFQVSSGFFEAATSGQCDPGNLKQSGIDDGVRALTFFRWLTGLGPISANNDTYNQQAQLCAVTSAHNPANANAHHPDESSTCYTPQGAAGAGSSNIAWSYNMNGPGMIEQFMDDRGNDTTLGHRRWFLKPGLGVVGIGMYTGENTTYPWAGCVKVIGTGGGGGSAPPLGYIAYPPAGFVPERLTQTKLWSLSNSGIHSDFTVTVTEVSSGDDLPVTNMPLSGNYGVATIAWKREGWDPESGESYKVEVSDDEDTIIYTVKPVDC